MTTEPLTFAIVGHLVGDYLLQTDWMASNKKGAMFPPIQDADGKMSGIAWVKSMVPCVVHCLLWTAAVALFAGWWPIWWVPVVLFVTHFAQDHTTIITRWMKFNGQEKFMGPPLGPWWILLFLH